MNRIQILKTAWSVLIAVVGVLIFAIVISPEKQLQVDHFNKDNLPEKVTPADANDKQGVSETPFTLTVKVNNNTLTIPPYINSKSTKGAPSTNSTNSGLTPKANRSGKTTDCSSEEQKKANEDANAFVLEDIINTSDVDSEVGDGSQLTGALRPTPEKIAKDKKRARVLKTVRLNKIGLARINAERKKKGLPQLVAGRDVDIAPMGKDSVTISHDAREKELQLVNSESIVPPVASKAVLAEDVPREPSVAGSEPPPPGLPASVDNSTLQYFPPIRYQEHGSCGQWAGIYYNMTHETAMVRGWDAKTGGDYYRFSPMFSYNFINDGNGGNGSWMTDGWNIALRHGIPRWSEFYTTSDKVWCTDPNVYRRILEDRIETYTYLYDVDTTTGLNQLKELLNNGHTITYATFVYSWKYKTASDDPGTSDDDAYVGKDVVYIVDGTDGAHAMTIVGYDDNIWCDIDGDSIVDANEKGALRVANSWGTGWKESGFSWISYNAISAPNPVAPSQSIFWGDNVYYVNPRTTQHVAGMVAKITINHTQRDQVRIGDLGIGPVGGNTPDSYFYTTFLRYWDGGPYAFSGVSPEAQDFTYYLDFTDLLPAVGESKRWSVDMGEYAAGGGSLQIKKFELYDVDAGEDTLVAAGATMPSALDGGDTRYGIDWTYQTSGDLPPVAPAQFITVDENTSGSIVLEGSDPNGDSLTYTVLTQPANGTLSGTAPNFTYTPDVEFFGSDSFTWKVTGNAVDSPTATAYITVTEVPTDVSVTATDATATETGSDTGSWTITRSGGTTTLPLVINYSLGGDATSGSDYAVDLPSPVTIPVGESSVLITMTPVDDTDKEITETAELTITPNSAYIIQAGIATVTIEDNESNEPPVGNAGEDKTAVISDGSVPGLYFGEVPGNIDETTPNPEVEVVTDVSSKTEDTIAGNTTEIFTGQIYDADGQISFTENIDDKAQISIDGTLVINDDVYAARTSTANLNLSPGWHDIEIRISNGSGGSGPVSGIGIGYDPDGGTAWQPLADPGDGSFLRVNMSFATVTLAGSASDPDAEDTLTTQWSKFSGPSTVSFSDATALNSTATFNAIGDYVLRLTVSDGYTQVSDDMTVSVTESLITVTESDGSTDVTEGGADDTYAIVLSGAPTDDVTVAITTDAQLETSPVSLTFTTANWDTPQTVTVTAVDDETTEYSHSSTITHSSTSTDSNFNGMAIEDVVVNITDNDIPTYIVTYNDNGSNGGTAPNSQTKMVGIDLTLASNSGSLFKTGYSFAGWNTATDGSGTDYPEGANYSVDSALSLYAKWNANPVVEAGDPQTVYMTGNAEWTPALITTTAWYDAADADTITESGGSVSQWADKSGNSNHAYQETGTSQPAYDGGNNKLTFDGGDIFKVTNDPFNGLQNFAVVTLQKWNNNSSWGNVSVGFHGESNNGWQIRQHTDSTLTFTLRGTGGADDPSSTSTNNSEFISSCIRRNSSDRLIRQNGTQTYLDTADTGDIGYIGTNRSSIGGRFQADSWGNPSGYLNGELKEVIVIENATDADVEKVEGYLAHKWGMAGKLPTEHPYKSSPPGGSGAQATLAGSVNDPDVGDTVTTIWTDTGTGTGTGQVSFSDPSSLTSTAFFTAEGTYVLRLTADDIYSQVYDEVTITVHPEGALSVTYDGNGSDGASAPLDETAYSADDTVTVLGIGTMARTGYTFSHWDTAQDGSGTDYNENDTFTITENTTLYAQWTADTTYTLTVNNGTGSGSYTEGTEVAISANVPNGQHFVNWTGDIGALADASSASTTVTMPGSTVSVTANFAAGDVTHSADKNSDWSISQTEVESFINSYNGNNNNVSGDVGSITSDRITMRETMRVIYLFNQGGEYIGGQGTVDTYDITAPTAPPATVTTTGSGDDGDGSLVVSSTADSGVGSLRDAIAMAGYGETVIIDGSIGTITVLSEIVIDKSITIDGQGAAIVSGENQTRIFRIENDERDIDVTLKNMGIVDAENSSDEFGGAIYNNAQTLIVDTVLLDGNKNTTAHQDGVQYGKGGAIYSSGTLNIENCVFRNNQASEENDIYQE